MSHNFIDLTGKRFGKLIVMERAENNKHKESMWVCLCDCGNTSVISGNNLAQGRTKSCGCGKLGYGDLSGMKFGRLTVIESDGYANGGKRWKCKCDCGNECIASASKLVSGHKRSCGCLRHEKPYNYQGRDRNRRLYIIWKAMRQRCINQKSPAYPRYGGRGISICEEWNDYNTFEEWALANGYSDELTIDRIDSNGNYEPNNCRWATPLVQSNNRGSNRKYTYNGETKTVSEWANLFGISYGTLISRLKRGWPIAKAVETPLRGS